MDNPRKLALLSLVKSDTQECYSNIEINTVLSRAKLEKSDAGLYTLLYLGVTEKRMLLDHIIGKHSKTPVEKIDVETLNAIRLGLYQLIFTDRIPDYSAVDESVSLCPKRSRGFANAILRSFLRAGKKIDLPSEKWTRLSIEYSVPIELINLLRDSYGDDACEKIIAFEDRGNELSIRVNTLVSSTEELMAELKKMGYEPRKSKYADDIIKCNAPISEIKGFIDTGKAFIQDESSRICSKAVGAKAGDRVADVCACPGGKTFSMAIDMENKGEIFASDLHKNKLSLIEKGAKRLGIDIVSVREQNAKERKEEYLSCFDKVLCDVPCSGLGVILKKPDIKYKSIDSITSLPQIQYDILSNCSAYVKVGGTLVYSTCTICRAENESNILRFLEENDGFVPVDFQMGEVKSQNGMYTFLPHITGTDGFFVAKLKRVK
ncbi:MAG: 16S rRNA (cytosine(967)-C(5))-methyltransferase RsmB [Clostridia bacterium]|nr:16S rRNA (cytosine(967)-C(5))-methyltransferase RsmB [Clostridia bacterium]